MTNNTLSIMLFGTLICIGVAQPAVAEVPSNAVATLEAPLAPPEGQPKKLDETNDSERRQPVSDEFTYQRSSSESGDSRTLHYRLEPKNEVDRDGPPPVERTGAASAIDNGTFTPQTLTARITKGTAWFRALGGYDSAAGSFRARSSAEAALNGYFAIRVDYEHGPGSGLDDRVGLGGRVQLLNQGRHGLDLGFGAFYQPKDFRSEGNVVGAVMLGRRFGRVGLFGSALFGSDPEGDDQDADGRMSLLYRATDILSVGWDNRFHYVLSTDQKRFGTITTDWELQLEPAVMINLGPLAILSEAGFSALQNTGPIGKPEETPNRTHGDSRHGWRRWRVLKGAIVMRSHYLKHWSKVSCLGLAAFQASCSSAPTEEATSVNSQEALRLQRHPVVLQAPAGNLPATRTATIDGRSAAVLPNGRLVTPAGVEVNLAAPKPFGLALSPTGGTLAAINSGSSRFSVSLIGNLGSQAPTVTSVALDATFMGVVFSRDGLRFYASGGENGNIWVGDTALGKIIGSVNLNGAEHPLDRPLNSAVAPTRRFKGTFPGNMALSRSGRYLYVVDQGGFKVHVIDTTLITTGVDANGFVSESDNFVSVVNRIPAGRYPFGVSLSQDEDELYVTHVGVFQYTHLRPEQPVGDNNVDYPLCYPAVGYPDETSGPTQIKIKKVDPRQLPEAQRDPEGIRCGYVSQDLTYTVPGLGDPNANESSSVYVIDVRNPLKPHLHRVLKPGRLVGQVADDGIAAYSGSHPNAVASTRESIYVANGNNDTVSVFDARSLRRRFDISLTSILGSETVVKGVQPVALAISPDESRLYVAEAGINAVAVVDLGRGRPSVLGHIPVGWWPSSLQLSADGATLYVANAKGRGSGPDNDAPPDNLGSPKHSTMGTVNIVSVPNQQELRLMTLQVLKNNGLLPTAPAFVDNGPIPSHYGVASRQIKHVIFINKENSTHDQMLGDITVTRKGIAVNGEPRYSLGQDASPNHHELALHYAFSDNFYLEPTVSSDGHRWLTDMYTTEMEETHWPASYGGRRRDSGDDPNSFLPYPGRLGFTDADGSPDPNDYNVHGGIYLHLSRNHKSFVNFGNGYEFAIVDEDRLTDPTGIRQHVNVPMEKVVRDNSDHLFPEYNTAIPDAPLAEDPSRFSRFGRFKQVFEAEYVNRNANVCNLPAYVDLYYPNDHGGGAFDINPTGPQWSYKRFVQDNDAALGLTVELISNSPCWRDTVIFVVEDDTQNGLDHVDGYRSLFLAISPWVKREYVSKTHTSLASVFKTTELILGMPALNQYDLAATDLRDMFTSEPDFAPYTTAPIALATRPNRLWRTLTKGIDFSRPDADEERLQRAIRLSEGLPRRIRSRKAG